MSAQTLMAGSFPDHWWAFLDESHKPSWEILPHEAGLGCVVLSKRNELGLLSNFAETPFELDGERYQSIEGLWQSLKLPEGPNDPRMEFAEFKAFPVSRLALQKMVGFNAKRFGSKASEIMDKHNIDWVSYRGERMPYRAYNKTAAFYKLIRRAMQAKYDQNPAVRKLLAATGHLRLQADHLQSPFDPPAWHYQDIWMEIRGASKAPLVAAFKGKI
jgi:predicted NAD-dependent protein-ADP-ribosyltransferase YbiA (DUF1768 family)